MKRDEAEREFYRGNPDDWVPVKARVSAKPSVVFSLQFSPEELDGLRQRAREKGTTISHLIRSAALSSCACGGQEPLAVKEGLWTGSELDGVEMLQEVRILFFALPAEENDD